MSFSDRVLLKKEYNFSACRIEKRTKKRIVEVPSWFLSKCREASKFKDVTLMLGRSWKGIRMGEYKPKKELSVQERFIARRCCLERKMAGYNTAKKDFNWVVRDVSSVRKLIRHRQRHARYKQMFELAKRIRENRSASEIVQAVPTSRYGLGGYVLNLLKFADAELDMEGKTDAQIEAMMFMEEV
jgi:hypothetical protein